MSEQKIERKGENINIREWLSAKDAEGNLKNVSPAVFALFEKSEDEKDESGRVIRVVAPTVAAYVADASLKDEKKGIKYAQEFVALEALTIEGANTLMDGLMDVQPVPEGKTRAPGSVCSYFSQAYAQTFRNNATAQLRTAIEGPEKQMDKAVALLVKALGISEADARKRVYGE